MKEYKKLVVWQKSIELVKLVYTISKELPNSEQYGLSSQIKRAAVSIAANIAEANGRNSNGERKQFLGVSLGSAYELETELIIIVELKLASHQNVKVAMDLLDEVQKMTAALIRNIKPAMALASSPLISNL